MNHCPSPVIDNHRQSKADVPFSIKLIVFYFIQVSAGVYENKKIKSKDLQEIVHKFPGGWPKSDHLTQGQTFHQIAFSIIYRFFLDILTNTNRKHDLFGWSP